MINIRQNPERELWDEYVAGNEAAQYSHLHDWGESLAVTYDLPIFRLAAEDSDSGRLSGILPLIHFHPPGGEPRLISLPYTDSAGCVADEQQTECQLLEAALTLGDGVEADHVELRQSTPIPEPFLRHLPELWSYTPHRFKTGLARPLPATVQELWLGLQSKVRNQVRKARKSGGMTRTGGMELLADFYAVFSENMRDLGSPVHTPEIFHSLARRSPQTTTVIVVYLEGKPAAAAFVQLHNAILYNPWASSLRRYRPFCPNMLLYWSMLEYAVSNHCHRFDFGRSSPNAATFRFKSQWGARKSPLIWHVFSRKPHRWDPLSESLEGEKWQAMELDLSRKTGPSRRRWISL